MKTEKAYDVVAVNLTTSRVRLIAANRSRDNAEAIESMAVMRRGVDEEFFTVVSAGSYLENSLWEGGSE